MLFLMVDRVDDYQPGHLITTRKLTSAQESYWQQSEQGPVMPVGLIIESLLQTSATLVMLGTEYGKTCPLLSMGSVKKHRDVFPGDTLSITVEIITANDDTQVINGVVRVDEQLVLEAKEIMSVLVDMNELHNPDELSLMMQNLYPQSLNS